MTIFVDTSGLYDYYVSNSQHHHHAARAMNDVRQGRWGVVLTSNYVLVELLALISPKVGHQDAASCGNAIRRSRTIQVVFVDEQKEKRAWNRFCRFRDEETSFTDCTSFVIIDTLEIDHVFAHDKHFIDQGYHVL